MAVRIAGLQVRHLAVIVKVVRIAATKPTTRRQQAGRVVPLVAGVAEITMARSSRALEKQSAVRIAALLSSWRFNARMVIRNLVLFCLHHAGDVIDQAQVLCAAVRYVEYRRSSAIWRVLRAILLHIT